MDWKRQGVRYAVVGAVVGAASNFVLYAAYLGLTAVGVGPKSAMTVLYAYGILQTYLLNKAWTFQQNGVKLRGFRRYHYEYLASYVLNIGVLYLFVDRLGMPHRIVQGIAIIGIAVLLFVAQRSWVFPDARHRQPTVVEST